MPRMSREEQQQRVREQVQIMVEENKSFPVRVLKVLAEANSLCLPYCVTYNAEKTAVDVHLNATEQNLGYSDMTTARVWFEPNEANYTESWYINDLEFLCTRVQEYRNEQTRLANVKAQALDKLTDEEKRVLGLLPNNRESFR